jgi:hypothetical protein
MPTTKKVARKKVTQKKTAAKKAVSSKSVKKTVKKTARKSTKKTAKKTAKKTQRTRAERTSFDDKLAAVEAFHEKRDKKAPSSRGKQVEKTALPSKQRLKKPALRNSMLLSVVSAANFPANIDALAIQTARIGGVAFVVLGGLFALNFSQYLLGSVSTSAMLGQTATTTCDETTMSALDYQMCLNQQGLNDAMGDNSSELDTAMEDNSLELDTAAEDNSSELDAAAEDSSQELTEESEDNSEDLEGAIESEDVQQPPAEFLVNAEEPLKDTVEVQIAVDGADEVKVLAFQGSYTNPIPLGDAYLTATPDVWEFVWDTTEYPDDEYKIAADIFNPYHTTNPYRDASAKYLTVNNTGAEQTTTEIDTEPAADFAHLTSNPVDTEAVLQVSVSDAEDVRFVATYTNGGSPNALSGSAKEVSDNVWEYTWDTELYGDGLYDVVARVKNVHSGKFYRAGELQVEIQHPEEETGDPGILGTLDDTAEDTADAIAEDDSLETEEDDLQQQDLPEVSLTLRQSSPLSGIAEMRIDTREASTVTLYAKRDGSATKQHIGIAKQVSRDIWLFRWNTREVPNAEYDVFAEVKNTYGTYTGEAVAIEVRNEVFVARSESQESEIEKIESAAKVGEVLESPLGEKEQTRNDDSDDESRSTANNNDEDSADVYLKKFREEIDAELQRFAAAQRSRDEARIDAAYDRIERLKESIVAGVSDSEEEKKLLRRIDTIVEEYKNAVIEVDALIAERVTQDVFRDSDNDGITDYDEISIFNTDPFSADTDGDGFIDSAEIENGFDPTNPRREVAIVHESPKEKGVARPDVLKVTQIESVVEDGPVPDTDGVSAQAVISGTGLPNSYVTIYIFSTPVVVTVKTDEDGAWRYRFDKELEDGQHDVYVGVTDNAGRIVAKSEPFSFIKEAQAFSPVDAAVSGSAEVQDTTGTDQLLSQYMVYLIISISVVSIVLVSLGSVTIK